MGGPHPAVAAVRRAVRVAVLEAPAGSLLLAACSGGADSTALLAGLAWEAPRAGRRAGCVTVDHELQPGSAAQAEAVARTASELDVAEVHVVQADHDRGVDGPEGDARRRRYAAMDRVAATADAALVLLGHTLDDQAETVLLRLARGSGARSLAGMRPARDRYRRPLLGLPRATTAAACAALGLPVWDDPMNADPAYARARVRASALPALVDALGPGVPAALARCADLLRDDADALDELAAAVVGDCMTDAGLDIGRLAALVPAIRRRVLHRVLIAAGASASALTSRHVRGVEELVTQWHGQRSVALPGGLVASRRSDMLLIGPGD
jgi:tRNA(Ile)-lysidine synthase